MQENLNVPPDPIERRNVYEVVAERILDLIRMRHLEPGDPVPTERELTSAYAVGRSSVREALRMLEARGAISADERGTFVVAAYANPLGDSLRYLLALDEGSLRDVYEIRRVLEVEIAALAAKRRHEADLQALEATLAAMAEVLSEPAGPERTERFVDQDVAFHLALAAAGHNGIALRMMQALRDVLHDALLSVYEGAGTPEDTLNRHTAIAAAVRRGDEKTVRRELDRHLTRVEREALGSE